MGVQLVFVPCLMQEPVISKKTGKPVYGYAAYVSQEWSEINKTRTEKVTQKKFIAISKKN